MATIKFLDSAEQAPAAVKRIYKFYQKLPGDELQDSQLVDLGDPQKWSTGSRVKADGSVSLARLMRACEGCDFPSYQHEVFSVIEKPGPTIYGIEGFPGRPSAAFMISTRLILSRIAGATRPSPCTCSETPLIEPTPPRFVQSTAFDKCPSALQTAL